MKAKIYVTLKNGLLDPQGQAVGRTLGKLGYQGVQNVRIGKFVEIEMDEEDPAVVKEQVTKMCDELIANSVMENFVVEVE